jgi:hypothetical protein
MTAVAYYAGLRPSEALMLRSHCLHLPATGCAAPAKAKYIRIVVGKTTLSCQENRPPSGLFSCIEALSHGMEVLVMGTKTEDQRHPE